VGLNGGRDTAATYRRFCNGTSAVRQFVYLPFQPSENLADQERCVELARSYGDDEFKKYAEQHADIIRRFGRFPHRNATLGRATSPQEQAFLDAGGFAG
jgi:uncharacterized protein (DUF924 family)